MKTLFLLLGVVMLVGCAGTHRKGSSHFDEYDALKVDQMVGNNVSQIVFAKTIVCLNARRETRQVTALTNVTVVTVTNKTILAVTNQTVSIATNFLVSSMTNLAPALAGPSASPNPGDAAALPPVIETNILAQITPPGPTITTNITVSTANNQSTTTAPNQIAANNQVVRTYNNQITTTSNNVSISMMNNQVVTAETNQVVFYTTNYALTSLTNIIVTPANQLVHDYFLYTELTPPPDFTLATGESLVLLIDGTRYGFSQSQSGTALIGRKGFTSGLYRVPPAVLIAIANAKEVRIRFKGVNNAIERTMSAHSKQNFRTFLLNYFSPAPESDPPKAKTASAVTLDLSANL